MSASMQPALFAIDGGRSALSVDRAVLRRLRHSFDLLPSGALEVLDDEDGAVTRFLCRGGRLEFLRGEVFVAAAVRRYFERVADRRLACMMYVDALSQDFTEDRVSRGTLRRALESTLGAPLPKVWLESLCATGAMHTLLLQHECCRLEVLARTGHHWIYGLLET